MENKTLTTLLEENKENIKDLIQIVTIESFMPVSHCAIGIFLNEENGQPEVHYAEKEIDFYLEDYTPSRLLYSTRSHAVREGDFKQWLIENDINTSGQHNEKKLKQLYPEKYDLFWEENIKDAVYDISHTEEWFDTMKVDYILNEILNG